MHNVHQSFAVRQRVLQNDGQQGHAGDLVHRHRARRAEGEPVARCDRSDGRVDAQHRRRTRARASPAIGRRRAVDSCFDVTGKLIYAGDDAWNGILDDKPAGPCTQRFPIYSTSRIVAGAPIEGGIYKCALKSVEQAVADGTYAPWTPSAARGRQAEADLPGRRVRLQPARPGAALIQGSSRRAAGARPAASLQRCRICSTLSLTPLMIEVIPRSCAFDFSWRRSTSRWTPFRPLTSSPSRLFRIHLAFAGQTDQRPQVA